MKNIFVFVLLFSSVLVFGQQYYDYEINFEDTSQYFRIDIDTLSNPNNIWQIGEPQKETLNSAFSIPNAIITDTVNPYPPNDTSSFIITHIADGGFIELHTAILSGYYKSDSDSLEDYGLIEFSPDHGSTWINLVDDPFYNEYLWWYTPKPILTGVSSEWQHFYVNLAQIGEIFEIEYGDTLYYKFTFISDSNHNPRGGLMYDDFHLEDWYEAIDENSLEKLKVNVFPIPAQSEITIEYNNEQLTPFSVEIFDINGQLMMTEENTGDKHFTFDIEALNSGLYFFHLTNIESRQRASGKIVKK